jgi:hypothetical protein
MRKLREVLRLKVEAKLSHEQIATATGVSKGAVANYVRRAAQQRVGWAVPEDVDDGALERLLSNIDLDEGTCSLDLVEAAADYFGLTLPQARIIIKEVATVTVSWRDVAKAVGARSSEINRMASAFEHEDLRRALLLA